MPPLLPPLPPLHRVMGSSVCFGGLGEGWWLFLPPRYYSNGWLAVIRRCVVRIPRDVLSPIILRNDRWSSREIPVGFVSLFILRNDSWLSYTNTAGFSTHHGIRGRDIRLDIFLWGFIVGAGNCIIMCFFSISLYSTVMYPYFCLHSCIHVPISSDGSLCGSVRG